MIVEPGPHAPHVSMPDDRCKVPPKTAHYVHGKEGEPCKFTVVQGVGEYDGNA